jgi:hypothetical protein
MGTPGVTAPNFLKTSQMSEVKIRIVGNMTPRRIRN